MDRDFPKTITYNIPNIGSNVDAVLLVILCSIYHVYFVVLKILNRISIT